jgi:hypothetical protein
MSLRDGVRGAPPMYLWYRIGKTSREMTPEEKKQDVITELDVLFGEDRPWYGFQKVQTPIHSEVERRLESVWLTYRKAVQRQFTFFMFILTVHVLFSGTQSTSTSLFS